MTRPIGLEIANASIPADYPSHATLKGRFVTLEPLQTNHVDDLYQLVGEADNGALWDYMFVGPFTNRNDFKSYIEQCSKSKDPLFFAIIDNSTNKAIGFASYLRIDPVHKSIETGNILYSSKLQRTIGATEVAYLLMKWAFELGYRRYEWKCNNLNAPSKRAAERLGFKFEGIFRNHMIVKGRNRDTAWYSITDDEWPTVKKAFEAWLDESNFERGNQLKRLEEFR